EKDHSAEWLVVAGHPATDLGQLEIVRSRHQGPTEQEGRRNQHKCARAPIPHGVDVNGHARSPRILVIAVRTSPATGSKLSIECHSLYGNAYMHTLYPTEHCGIKGRWYRSGA